MRLYRRYSDDFQVYLIHFCEFYGLLHFLRFDAEKDEFELHVQLNSSSKLMRDKI